MHITLSQIHDKHMSILYVYKHCLYAIEGMKPSLPTLPHPGSNWKLNWKQIVQTHPSDFQEANNGLNLLWKSGF